MFGSVMSRTASADQGIAVLARCGKPVRQCEHGQCRTVGTGEPDERVDLLVEVPEPQFIAGLSGHVLSKPDRIHAGFAALRGVNAGNRCAQ